MENPQPIVPPTPSPTPTQADCEHCKTGICGKCLKGGFPIGHTLLTLISLGLLIVVVVLGVFSLKLLRESGKVAVVSDEKQEVATSPTPYPMAQARSYANPITLPAPKLTGKMSLETAIETRRSRRTFSSAPVTLAQLSQVLWSGQGITDDAGHRAAPSSRESYPMTLFVVVKDVTGLAPGLYEYLPKGQALGLISTGDMTQALKDSGVEPVAQAAPVTFILTASFGKYQTVTKSSNMVGTYMEAGHIGQNMYLETESLGMATVVTGGFDTKKVTTALKLDPAETVEYVIPFGHPGPVPTATPAPVK